jgi:hypothetical protein
MSPLEAGEGMRKTECEYDGYDVVGSGGGNIGTVGCLFKDEANQWEYLEVKGGLVERFLGTGYYLLPMELCTVDHERGTVRTSVDEDTVKNSPYLDSSLDLSQHHASGVRDYYRL